MEQSRRFVHLQDVLGSMPMHQRYMAIAFFFLTTHQGIEHESILCELRTASSRLSNDVPWLAGRVTKDERGHPLIVPFEENFLIIDHDARTICQSMSDLYKAGIPFSMMPEEALLPINILPDNFDSARPYEESLSRPARVLIVQLTRLEGGYALAFLGNHTTMDMNGFGQVISMFAKYCTGDNLSQEERDNANQDRRSVVPLLEHYEPGPEAQYFTYQPANEPDQEKNPDMGADPVCAYFRLSGRQVEELRKEANESRTTSWISTNDAISTLAWQCIAKARYVRLHDPLSKMFRQTSARRLLNLKGYTGDMATPTHHQFDFVWEKPLGAVASELRSRLQDYHSMLYELRAMVTMLVKERDFIGYGADLDFDRDVVIASYADIPCCELSFGSLAHPVAVRRANFASGGVNIMPKDADGSVAIAIGLGTDDMKMLKQDMRWQTYSTFVG